MNWLHERLCWLLTGHDYLTKGVDRTIVQECVACGYRTHGVELGRAPVQRFSGDPQRHQLGRQA